MIHYEAVDIESIECIGNFEDEYVYDIEVDDDCHNFFGNDILVHNSAYVNFERVTRSITPDGIITKDNFKSIMSEVDKVEKAINDWCREDLSPNILNAKDCTRIKFVREIFADVGYFFKKKRYLVHILDLEGKKPDKKKEYKYKGISLVKSIYPAFAKDIVRHVYEHSIKERWNEIKFVEYMNNAYKDFCNRSFEEISEYKNLSSYKESDEFLSGQKGTTGHAKAALYYNQLIEKMGLTNKYNIVKNGKIRLCYINRDNPYKIDVIGFEDKVPEEFKEFFKPDYRKMFNLIILKPLEAFIHCNSWSEWENFDEREVDILTL